MNPGPYRVPAVGALVKSKMGHDRGRVYLVLTVEPPFVYVADGVYRGAAVPKKKRATHVEPWGPKQEPVELTALFWQTTTEEQNRQIRTLINQAAKQEGGR